VALVVPVKIVLVKIVPVKKLVLSRAYNLRG
jgi:hypothetical protein